MAATVPIDWELPFLNKIWSIRIIRIFATWNKEIQTIICCVSVAWCWNYKILKFDMSFFSTMTTLSRQNIAIFESSSGLKGQNTSSLGHRPRWFNEPWVAPCKGKTTRYGMVHHSINEWFCPYWALLSSPVFCRRCIQIYLHLPFQGDL